MVAPGFMPQTQASSAPAAAALALPALERAALFFDVDGTLLDIRPDPRDVLTVRRELGSEVEALEGTFGLRLRESWGW